jgi:hypothetical protein
MKIVKSCLLLLTVLCSVAAVHAQTADDIIAKHIAAIGGKEKLKGINAVRMENTMQVMGQDAPSTTVIVNGKGFRNESDFNGQKMIQVVTDKGGWMVNPMAGATEPQSMPAEQLKGAQEQIYVVPFLDYAARGNKAELLGQEKLGTVNAYKVKLTTKDSAATTYYFDPTTYYLIQAVRTGEMMGQQMDVTTSYSDFKKTDYGWVVPQAMEINMGGQFSLTAKVNKVEVNPTVDPKVFDMAAK